MRGYNEVRLNEATMMEAVQHYFKTVVYQEGKVPKVTSVKQTSHRHDNDTWFTINCENEAPKDE